MAKSKNEENSTDASNKSTKKSPNFMDQLMSEHEKNFQKVGKYVGRSDEDYTVVMPNTPLALQYLMGVNGEPLRQMLFIAGPYKSYKTSLMLDICNRVVELDPSGFGFVMNTESKWSSTKTKALMGDNTSNMRVVPIDTMQEWQNQAITLIDKWTDIVKTQTKNNPAPVLFMGVDSLVGAQTEYMQKKVDKEGTGRTVYDRAQTVYQFAQTQNHKLLKVPAMLVITNHLQENTQEDPYKIYFNDKFNTSGGTATGFHCAMEMRIRSTKTVERADGKTIWLELRLHHSSISQIGRKLKVPYKELWDYDLGQQTDYFDWNTALINLLMGLLGKDSTNRTATAYAEQRKKIEDVIGGLVEYKQPNGKPGYACKVLGIEKKDVESTEVDTSAEAVGRMLQEDPYILDQLQKVLAIHQYPVWQPGMEFWK